MIRYEFILNGYENGVKYVDLDLHDFYNSTYPFIGFSDIEQRITGVLNNGYIEIISDTQENFPMFMVLTLKIVDTNYDNINIIKQKSWYIGQDKVSVVDKEKSKWLHEIELIDLTKKLEKYTLETITFTQNASGTRWTILSGIRRLLDIFNLSKIEQVDNRIRFNIYDNLLINYNSLENELPDVVLSKLTLREAINELLKSVNGIIYLDYDLSTHRMMLDIEWYNDLKETIEKFNSGVNVEGKVKQLDSYNQEHNIDDYESQIDNFVENQINEVFEESEMSWYPNKNGFATARARESEYEMTDSNFGILLPQNIYTVNKAIVKVGNAYIKIFDTWLRDLVNYNLGEIDITKFLVDSEQYAGLPTTIKDEYTFKTTTNDVNYTKSKSNCIYYTYKDNFINFGNTYKGVVFERYSWKNALAIACLEKLLKKTEFINTVKQYATNNNFSSQHSISIEIKDTTNNNTLIYYDSSVLYNGNGTYVLGNFYLRVSNIKEASVNDLRCRVNYSPIYNTRLRTQKSDTTQVQLETSGFSNQKAKIINLKNLGIYDKSLLERVGNQNFSITVRHEKLTDLYKNGDYTTDGFIITKSEYVYYDNFILGKYELTKNYSKLSEFIGIQSEYRPYEIPSGKEVYERNILYNTYCFVGKPYDFLGDNINTTYENNEVEQVILNKLINKTGSFKINGAILPQNSVYDLFMPTIVSASANNIIATFTFSDNICAGYYIITDNLGKKLMQKVLYTNLNGEKDFFHISLVNAYYNNDMSKLPLVPKINYNNTKLISLDNLYVDKDKSEIIKFTYELSYISNDIRNIIIGKDFTKYNGLVNGNAESEDFYIYGGNEAYTEKDLTIKENSFILGDVYATLSQGDYPNTVKMDFLNAIPKKYNWYAIGQKNRGKILLAFTKEYLINGIEFTYTDERIDLKRDF